jgi:predicted lipoprotein with Yx(FWY)xxD motif
VKSKTFGTILVGASGRTLYRYTVDRKQVNRCTSDPACNPYWPPLLVKAGVKVAAGTGVKAASLGTIKAKNGQRQVTYAGWPLYYFAGDKKAGQTSGQAFQKEWYVVNTKGALVKHAVAAPTSATTTPTTTSSGGPAWG